MATESELKKQKAKLEAQIKEQRKGGTTPAELASRQQRVRELQRELDKVNEQLGVESPTTSTRSSTATTTTTQPQGAPAPTRTPTDYVTRRDAASQVNDSGIARLLRARALRSEIRNIQAKGLLTAQDQQRIYELESEIRQAGSTRVIIRDPNEWNPTEKALRSDLARYFLAQGIGSDALQFQVSPSTIDPNIDFPGGSAQLGDYRLTENPYFANIKFGPKNVGKSGNEAFWRAVDTGTAQERDITMLNGMSVKEMYAFFNNLTGKDLIRFQNALMEAGMYDYNQGEELLKKRPTLGMKDGPTREALENLMHIWGQNIDLPLEELMSKLKDSKKARVEAEVGKSTGGRGGAGGRPPAEDFIAVTDPKTLNNLVDQVAVQLFGSGIDPQRKAEIVARLHQKEIDNKTAIRTRELENEYSTGNSELDDFISALIGEESGGDPNAVNARTGAFGLGQITPASWRAWTAEGRFKPDDRSVENQMAVIRDQVSRKYAMYKNWRDVAAWWYSGLPLTEFTADELSRGQGPAGDEESIQSYVDTLMSRMANNTAASLKAPKVVTYNQFDVQAEAMAALKEADPLRYKSTQFRRQADVFFSLLGGLRRGSS